MVSKPVKIGTLTVTPISPPLSDPRSTSAQVGPADKLTEGRPCAWTTSTPACAANMNHEAWLGFNAFDAKKPTGKDVIDFIKFRQLVAEGALFDDKFAEQVMAKPKS